MGLTPTEKRRLARAIQAAVPGLVAKRSLLIATPRGRIARGFCIDAGQLWTFVQPLFLRATDLDLSFAKTLGGGSGGRAWHAKDVDKIGAIARAEGEPFFRPVWSPETFLRWKELDKEAYVHREAIAYALVASGQFARGARALRGLADLVDEGFHANNRRALKLAGLAETNPPRAEKLLARWESETASALQIADVP